MQVNMLEAKTHLSKLVEAVLRGEEVIIANRGKPVVKLVRAEARPTKRNWGAWEGLISDEDIEAAFTPEADAEVAELFALNARARAARATEAKVGSALPAKTKRRGK